MVSLVELSKVTEEGVCFSSPYDGKEILLTPEKSIEIQNALGKHYLLYNAKVTDASSCCVTVVTFLICAAIFLVP